MTKHDILEYFKDINYAYDNSNQLDTLSSMIDELLEEKKPKKAEYIWICPKCGSQLILKTSKVNNAIGLSIDECPVCGGKMLYGKTD